MENSELDPLISVAKNLLPAIINSGSELSGNNTCTPHLPSIYGIHLSIERTESRHHLVKWRCFQIACSSQTVRSIVEGKKRGVEKEMVPQQRVVGSSFCDIVDHSVYVPIITLD